VIQTCRSGAWRRATLAPPRVQANVVVVAVGGDEGGLIAAAGLLFEPKNVAPETERALDVGDLQVDVANIYAGVD
jgi:hypothetical protein